MIQEVDSLQEDKSQLPQPTIMMMTMMMRGKDCQQMRRVSQLDKVCCRTDLEVHSYFDCLSHFEEN